MLICGTSMRFLAGFMGLEEIDADTYLGSLGNGQASTAEAQQDSRKKVAKTKKRKEAPGVVNRADVGESAEPGNGSQLVPELKDESAGAADVAEREGPSKKKQKKAKAAAERQVLTRGGTTDPSCTGVTQNPVVSGGGNQKEQNLQESSEKVLSNRQKKKVKRKEGMKERKLARLIGKANAAAKIAAAKAVLAAPPVQEAETLSQEEAEAIEVDATDEGLGSGEVDMSAWAPLTIHPLLEKALAELGFKEPTAIQRECIPAAAHQGRVWLAPEIT